MHRTGFFQSGLGWGTILHPLPSAQTPAGSTVCMSPNEGGLVGDLSGEGTGVLASPFLFLTKSQGRGRMAAGAHPLCSPAMAALVVPPTLT